MSFAAGSASDNCLLLDQWDHAAFPSPWRNPDSYTAVNPNLVAGETTCVIIGGGQSTITNCGTASAYVKVSSNIHMMNIYTGGMYSAINAMIGVDGDGECFLIRLADKMIAAGKYQRVILVPFGLGSTDIARWTAGAFCDERTRVACQRVKSAGLLSATQVYTIWQQGESDTVLATSQATMTAGISSVISTARAVLPTTPFYVSKTSYENGFTSAAVRAAQAAVVTGTVFAGPDTDTLGGAYRHDNIHWNGAGSDAVAGLWNAVLT